MSRLEKQLKKQGYYAALDKLDAAKRLREQAQRSIAAGVPYKIAETPQYRNLDELVSFIHRAEDALKAEYESTVKLTDSENDLDLIAEDLLETMELVAEELEGEMKHPEAAEWIRALARGEDPGPPPPKKTE